MLLNFCDWLVYGILGLKETSRFAGALHFFVLDSIKIFVLLAAMIFAIGVLRTYLPEHRIRNWMAGKGLLSHVSAALFGALTPFCSCSSIPIFFAFLHAGIPLGVVFSFLVASPLINEYLVVLMAGFFGWKIAAAYVAMGLTIGVFTGMFIGSLHLEDCIDADFSSSAPPAEDKAPSFVSRLHRGLDEAWSIIRKIWVWVLAGVAAGAAIHNYVPEEAVQHVMQSMGPFSVPAAVILGVPMYGSCAAIVPVAVVLFQKGIPLGTALSFMMAVAALSLPEAIMLRRAMNLKLIGIFFLTATLAMIFTGYAFNFLEHLLT